MQLILFQHGHNTFVIIRFGPFSLAPQILEHWGYAHEVHLDKCNRAMDFGLEF